MYDIIIIGAGVAGLTSAIYGLRANKKVLVLEKRSYGGQIIESNEVDNYPGVSKINGFDFATNIYNQVIELGGDIKYEEVIKITEDKHVVTVENDYVAGSVILATGVSSKKLGLENEDKLVGSGISYCATCDGNFYKNKIVMVVGGGNTALEEAIYLSNICKKVYLVHRRDSFRGEENLLNILNSKENVEIIYNSEVIKINGNEFLESVIIENKLKEQEEIELNGLFIAIGKVPNNDIFKDIVNLDQLGYVKSSDCTTNKDFIFVAGDTRQKELRQLVTATSDGALAATLAINYLNSKN